MKQILSSIFILLLFALEAHPASNASLYQRVKAAYEELLENPSAATEVKFFLVFPENCQEFTVWEQQFNDNETQKETMYIEKYIEMLGKLTAINDDVYCRKLIRLSSRLTYGTDGQSCLQRLLRDKMNTPSLFGTFVSLLSGRPKGEQLRFWMFYWFSLSFIEEGYEPKKKEEARRPELNLILRRLSHHKTMRKIVRLAYDYSAYQVFFT